MTGVPHAGERAAADVRGVAAVKVSPVEQLADEAASAGALVVTVFGKPVTQGSKTRTRWGVRDDNADRLRPWREAVKQAALDVIEASSGQRLEGPVSLAVAFTFDPPKSAPKSRPCWPITRSSGDVDKLVRAVGDALTDAGVWRDDSQVVRLIADKLHVGDDGALHIPGAYVTVRPVTASA